MRTKSYASPEISVLYTESFDIITVSDPTLGTETPPTEAGSGSWETI